MRTILTVFALLFLASCQDAAVTGNDPSNTTTLSARVQRAQGVSTAVYDSTYTVNVSLTAGSSYQRTLTPAFSDHGCDFTGVPVGVPYTLSFQGLNRSGTMIWSGTATGTTASSTTDGSVSATSVTVVVSPTTARDSTLSVLSTNPGTFTATFSRTNTNYVDSVAAGVTSVTVTATASTPGDVSVITYNSQTNNVATLSTTDPTAILVVVTNRNGNSLTYTIKVYHKKATVIDSTFGIPWNSAITYGSLTDPRDGQSYRTVTIGSQTWMAQNLNYCNTTSSTDTVGVCYGYATDSCTKYGRLYTWAEVMAGSASSSASPSGVQGVCPTGWHVPSDSEWTTMQTFVDPTNTTDGTKLKSTSGWLNNGNTSGNGGDMYGFRALPGGRIHGASFDGSGYNGDWWSATANSVASNDLDRGMGYGVAYVYGSSDPIGDGVSLRCVQNPTPSTTPSLDSAFPIDANTIGLWRMNEGTGSTIANAVGGTSGTLYGGVSWVNGAYGKAVQFDGSSGYANLNFNPPQINATFEAVVNIQKDTGWLFTLWGAYNSGIALESNGFLSPEFSNNWAKTSANTSQDLYLALTVDSNHLGRLYINGVFADSGTALDQYSWSAITLASYTGTSGFVECSFERFRVSSKVRTAAEITATAQRAGLTSSILISNP